MYYRALMRRKLMEDAYNRMSDDEKRMFFQMSVQDNDHQEIMQALSELGRKADNNHHSFALDFGANIAGNAAWSALVFIGSKLLRKI